MREIPGTGQSCCQGAEESLERLLIHVHACLTADAALTL